MRKVSWIVKIGVMILLATAAFTFVTMSLWNWLVPVLFHGPVIDFWQALGLLVLSKILFSGFGKKNHSHGGHWRPYWKEKWNTMNPDERELFKQKMKEKWCKWGEKANDSNQTTGS
ncbi:MAG TPA: hypothetical protein DGG95_05490 [Cytophagales bacterium]|jgi:hypothetical protein|nr:hypothetical protein [Cytophagales bacterium]